MVKKKAKKKYDSTKSEVRRRRVLSLILSGFSETAIANTLGIHRTTVSRDKKFLMNEIKQELNENSFEYIIEKYIMQQDEVVKESWRVFRQSTNDAVKVGALKTIAASRENLINNLIKMGVIKEPSITVEIKGYEQRIREAYDDIQRGMDAKRKGK